MKIENWGITGNSLCGNVYGNPNFNDGDFVVTSAISKVEKLDGIVQVYTRNSVYELGVVDSVYETCYPDTENRLVKHFA